MQLSKNCLCARSTKKDAYLMLVSEPLQLIHDVSRMRIL